MPIVSYGVIVCRIKMESAHHPVPEFLMICRRRTLGYIDFMRGKYSTTNRFYILNMMKQMTVEEKQGLLVHSFDELWNNMWCSEEDPVNNQYRQEEITSKSKFQMLLKGIILNGETYNMQTLVQESEDVVWTEQEWGFPKGRRNYQENEYECAAREFTEETGYPSKLLKVVTNMYPFEEVFMGSNYKSYKHKYFLTFMEYADSLKHTFTQNTEVSQMEWLPLDQCLQKIRPYNEEKKRLLMKVNTCLYKYIL